MEGGTIYCFPLYCTQIHQPLLLPMRDREYTLHELTAKCLLVSTHLCSSFEVELFFTSSEYVRIVCSLPVLSNYKKRAFARSCHMTSDNRKNVCTKQSSHSQQKF